MEIFAWNPVARSETLEGFNQRLEDFCLANPVLDITPSVLGRVIVLSLTEAADAELATAACLIPRVLWVPAEHLITAETYLGQQLQVLKDRDTDDAPYIPFKLTLHPAGADGAYAVVLVGGGELEIAGEGEGGDAGDAGDAGDPDTGAIPPAVRGGKNR